MEQRLELVHFYTKSAGRGAFGRRESGIAAVLDVLAAAFDVEVG